MLVWLIACLLVWLIACLSGLADSLSAGLSDSLSAGLTQVARLVGYSGVHTDTALHNVPAIKVAFYGKAGMAMTGIMPKGIYFEGQGWEDVVVMYSRLEPKHSLVSRQDHPKDISRR